MTMSHSTLCRDGHSTCRQPTSSASRCDRSAVRLLTFTSAAVADYPVNAPTDDYLRTMAVGLREAHGWSAGQIGRYLAQFPGATGAWTSTAIEELAA